MPRAWAATPRRAPFIMSMTYLIRPNLRLPTSCAGVSLNCSSQVGEDRRFGVAIDGDDLVGVLHPDAVLDRPGDAVRGDVADASMRQADAVQSQRVMYRTQRRVPSCWLLKRRHLLTTTAW